MLMMFEDQIWAVLRDVLLSNVDLETALFQLVQSPIWTAMEDLPPTDPSVTFFCRLRTTLVPMPSRQILPAPAASSTSSGPPINMLSRPMFSAAASDEPAFLRPVLPISLLRILPPPPSFPSFSVSPVHTLSPLLLP